jgi:hypothetical protein
VKRHKRNDLQKIVRSWVTTLAGLLLTMYITASLERSKKST